MKKLITVLLLISGMAYGQGFQPFDPLEMDSVKINGNIYWRTPGDTVVYVGLPGSSKVDTIPLSEFKQIAGGLTPDDREALNKVREDSARWDSAYGFSKNVSVSRTNEFQYICVDGQQPSTPQPLDSSVHFSEGSMITIGDTIYHFFKQAIISHITNDSSRVVMRKRNIQSREWTEIRVLYDSIGIDDRNVSAGYVDGKFTVWFRRYNANTGDQIDAGYIYSDDGTQTWSDYSPYDFQSFVEADYLFYAPYGGFFTIGDSTYQGWYSVYSNADSCRSFWTSTVDGENWFETNKGETYRTLRSDEYWTEPYWNSFGGSDTVIALVRNQNGVLGKFQSLSFDGGLTWSALELTNLQRSKNGLTGPMMYYDEEKDWLFSIVVSRPPNGVQSTIERDSIYVQVVKKDSVIASPQNWNLISVMPIIYQSRLNSYGYSQMTSVNGGYLVIYIERTTRGYISSPTSRADSNEIAYIYEFDINLDSNQVRRCPTNLTNANQTYNQYTGNYEFRPDYFDAGFQTPPTASEVQMDPQRVLAITQNTFTDIVMWCTNRNGILQWYIDYLGNFVAQGDTVGKNTLSPSDKQAIAKVEQDSPNWDEAYARGDFRDYGLGGNVVGIPGGNANNIDLSGFYSVGPSTQNIPEPVSGVIIHYKRSSTAYIQKYYGLSGNEYERTYNSGWSPWRQLASHTWVRDTLSSFTLQTVMDNDASYNGSNDVDIATSGDISHRATNIRDTASSDWLAYATMANFHGTGAAGILVGSGALGSGLGGITMRTDLDRWSFDAPQNGTTELRWRNFGSYSFQNGDMSFQPDSNKITYGASGNPYFDFSIDTDTARFNKPVIATNIPAKIYSQAQVDSMVDAHISGDTLPIISADSPLDFPSTAVNSYSDINIVVPGAEVGDQVLPVIFPASIPPNSSYTAWVSNVNQVTIRFLNNGANTAKDPPSGMFTVNVMKISN